MNRNYNKLSNIAYLLCNMHSTNFNQSYIRKAVCGEINEMSKKFKHTAEDSSTKTTIPYLEADKNDNTYNTPQHMYETAKDCYNGIVYTTFPEHNSFATVELNNMAYMHLENTNLNCITTPLTASLNAENTIVQPQQTDISEQSSYLPNTIHNNASVNLYKDGKIAECSTNNFDTSQNISFDQRHTELQQPSTSQAVSNIYYTTNQQDTHLYKFDQEKQSEIFFYKTVNLLKILLYYRFNISQLVYIFYNQINKKGTDEEGVNREIYSLKQFIELSIHFAKNNSSNLDHNVVGIQEKDHKILKVYEKWISDQIIKKADHSLIKKSKEYKTIHRHNKNYLISLTKNIVQTEFHDLHCFLSYIFTDRDTISKYFTSIINLVVSLYDVSVFIEAKLKLFSHILFLESNVFEVLECNCSNEVKQYFVFHWAYCWLLYFSRDCRLPDSFTSDLFASFIIDKYPKKFFLQVVILVHFVINFDNENIKLKDLNPKFLLIFEHSVQELLFSNSSNITYKCLLQSKLLTLLKSISNIANHKIYRKNNVLNSLIIQTPKENLALSNELIPATTTYVEVIFSLTKESFQKAKKRFNIINNTGY